MELDRDQLQKDILAMYAREINELGEDGTREHVERGVALSQEHNLGSLLSNNGMLVFPHISVHDCGYQQAAAAHAARQQRRAAPVASSTELRSTR